MEERHIICIVKGKKVEPGKITSRNVSVGRRLLGYTFKVFAINQAFNASFHHVDVREESGREL